MASLNQSLASSAQQSGKLVSDDLDSSLANLVGSKCPVCSGLFERFPPNTYVDLSSVVHKRRSFEKNSFVPIYWEVGESNVVWSPTFLKISSVCSAEERKSLSL